MTVTKTQLADAYSTALNEGLGDEWDCNFTRRTRTGSSISCGRSSPGSLSRTP